MTSLSDKSTLENKFPQHIWQRRLVRLFQHSASKALQRMPTSLIKELQDLTVVERHARLHSSFPSNTRPSVKTHAGERLTGAYFRE